MFNVLFLTTVLPRQQRMGSEVASQTFIDGLEAVGCKVTVVGYMRKDDVFEALPPEIIVGKRYIETKKAKLNTLIWLVLSFLTGLPYSAAKYYSKSYQKAFRECLNAVPYDLVIVDHPQLGWLHTFAQTVMPKRHYKLVAIAHNVEHEIYASNADNTQNLGARRIYRREANLIKKLENNLAIHAHQVWALTDHDAAYFNRVSPTVDALAFALPPGMTPPPTPQKLSKTLDIGLIGSWAWKPNEEGLRWFLREVYPHLPDELNIQVAGRGAEWLTDQYANVRYVGFVPNAQTFMAQSRVVAIPTLSGGGIQIKTLDAIASGSQIVATPVALRGIAHPPESVAVTSDPKIFAAYLLKAIQSPRENGVVASQTWYRDRQQQFLQDLKTSISKLMSDTDKSSNK